MADDPQQEGFSGQARRIIGEPIEKYEMKFGAAEGLYRFTDQVRFFTPALLYLHGRFTDEPLVQFCDEQDIDLQLMHRRFEQPIFQGLHTPDGDPDWNYVLWGVVDEHYERLENYMLSITLTDANSGWVSRVGAADLEIVDPLWLDRNRLITPTAPRIPAVAWGVDSTAGALSLEAPPGEVYELPRLKRHPPQPETLAFAEALRTGRNPLAAREASLREQEGADDASDT